MKNVAIVGSNGFIGSHLVSELSKNNSIKLFLFGRSHQSVFGSQFPYCVLNLHDEQELIKEFRSIDIIYYLASATIPSSSWDSPIKEIENNLVPFINFMEIVSKLSVKKIVFVSSAGTIYGPSKNKLKEDSDKQPFSPYGIIKLTIEHFLNYFKEKNNINYDIYRVSNVYGEGQNTANGLGIINTFIENILINKKIQIFGNGENIRNYIYVKDVVDLLSHSLISDFNRSNVYNIASNDTISINQLVDIVKEIVQSEFEIVYEESRLSDNSTIDIDNEKILNEIPNFKFINIERGIDQTYQYIKEKNR